MPQGVEVVATEEAAEVVAAVDEVEVEETQLLETAAKRNLHRAQSRRLLIQMLLPLQE